MCEIFLEYFPDLEFLQYKNAKYLGGASWELYSQHGNTNAMNFRLTAHARGLLGILFLASTKTRKIQSPRNWLCSAKLNYRGMSTAPYVRPTIGSPRKTPVICCRVPVASDCLATFFPRIYTPMTIRSSPLQMSEQNS